MYPYILFLYCQSTISVTKYMALNSGGCFSSCFLTYIYAISEPDGSFCPIFLSVVVTEKVKAESIIMVYGCPVYLNKQYLIL